ncbi:enoyl-CoA hydratase/isomerase family protein [Microvirga sp. 0TCS3.31]
MTGLGQGLLLDKRDGIATITLSHPERANALDPAEFHALAGMLISLASDIDCRAVVLTGQGDRAFCAGLNLGNEEGVRHDLSSPGPTGLGAALRAAAALPVPIVGRINGACVAGGMGLLGVCDYAIASTTACFGLPEIRHGLYPFVALAGLHGRGSAAVLRRLAGSGVLIDAGAAADAGIIDSMCAPQDLDSAVNRNLVMMLANELPDRMLRRLAEGLKAIEARLVSAEARARKMCIATDT